jgi:cytochrome c-type biogenesis protein CcmH/NrfF
MRSIFDWRAAGGHPSGAKAQGDSMGAFGTTEVVPCYKAAREGSSAAGSGAHGRFGAFAARLKPRPFKALRIVQAAALVIAICFSLGATDDGARYSRLNHRLMCTCGCAEILGECNHVGCPNSTGELDELRAGIADGQSDKEILNSFVGRYGAVVLAAPTGQGFDVVAWIAPFAVFAAATLGTILLVKRWTVGKTEGAVAVDAAMMDPAARELREKIRRETGEDGGY